jgi:hypothetical protein
MNWRRLIVPTLGVTLLAVVVLAAISHGSDSMAGEKDSFYAADASTLSENISR